MALPSGTYAPRAPAASVLYQVVRDHYQMFRAEASRLRDGEGLPRFVESEFDAFLRCGWLPPHHATSAWRGPRGSPAGSRGSAARAVRPNGWSRSRAKGVDMRSAGIC